MALHSLPRHLPPGRFLAPLCIALLLAWSSPSVNGGQPQASPAQASVGTKTPNLLSREVAALSFVVASDDQHVVISDMAKRISRIALPGGEVVAQSSTAMLDDLCLLYKLGDRLLALGRKSMAVIDDTTLEVVASCSLERPHYLLKLMSASAPASKGAVWSILCDPGGGRLLFGIAPAGILAGFQLEVW